jgi:hypothetical protein
MFRARSIAAKALGQAALLFGLAESVLCCGSAARAGPEPEASLASSEEAQSEFRSLREQWVGTPLDARASLEPQLTRFVQRHPSDHQGRWVRLYLAWIARERNDLTLAERWLNLAEPGSAGAASDLGGVVRASIDLAAGRAAPAYEKLRELDGRLIDADDRLLCLDQLVSAALAAERYREAVLHMLELAAQAARRHRERMWRSLTPRLSRVPLPLLEASLPALSSGAIKSPSLRPAEKAAAVDWMRRQILELLSRSALEQKNVELAQRLVASARRPDGSESDESELLRLATRGGLAPKVEGRTLGLLLQLGEPIVRQRSMEVASGIAATLELASSTQGAGALVLETREVDVDGDIAGALARLASDGAGLLLAGLDAPAARAAAAFSARSNVPVLLLHEPGGTEAAVLPESAFIAGTDEVTANEPLRRTLAQRFDTLISVGSPETPCASDTAAAVPLGAVGPGSGQGLWIMGSAQCARSVFANLPEGGRAWTVGLGLDALAAQQDERAPRQLWAVGVARLPRFEQKGDAALTRWLSRKGRTPSFYEALGHDLALVGAAALPAAPAESLRDAGAVAEYHRHVLERIRGAVLGALWTSDGPRFGADRRWPREFKAVLVQSTGSDDPR